MKQRDVSSFNFFFVIFSYIFNLWENGKNRDDTITPIPNFQKNDLLTKVKLHRINMKQWKTTINEKKIDNCPPVAVPNQTKGINKVLCQLVEQFLSWCSLTFYH